MKTRSRERERELGPVVAGVAQHLRLQATAPYPQVFHEARVFGDGAIG